MQQIKNIKELTERALEQRPATRSNDTKLVMKILVLAKTYIFDCDLIKLVNSATRQRRRFQQDGFRLGTAAVMEQRRKHSKLRANEFRTTKKDIEKIAIKR